MEIFNDVDKCTDFITDLNVDNVFIIVQQPSSQMTIRVIQDLSQINMIYLLGGNENQYERSSRVIIFPDIPSICETLKRDIYQYNQNSVSMSFIKPADGISKPNLDKLDQYFMYTQILKEILLKINFQPNHIDEFLAYCRNQFIGDVTKLENEYRHHHPIWWYTSDCFLYSMLNKSLRLMEFDIIIKIDFFIRDLHQHIARLHTEQYKELNHSTSFVVYHGQGLSLIDFDKLMETQGGLLSFNTFLSTSLVQSVAFLYAESNSSSSDLVGVLFKITVDPSISSTPFCNTTNVGYYGDAEEEILFAMHSVFRIGEIRLLNENNRLLQVDLMQTSDNDPELNALTERIREETFPGQEEWYRLGQVLIKVGEFSKAQQVYDELLNQTSDLSQMAGIYFHLGWIKDNQEEFKEAIGFYEKLIEINEQISDKDHPQLAYTYNNLGIIYNRMGEYLQALQFHEKAVAIRLRILSPIDSTLATSYNNIGRVHENRGKYSKALLCYEKALKILQETLPSNHPQLTISHNNIGGAYINMSNYSKALLHLEKAREIEQRSLPPNHPNLIYSVNNLGALFGTIGEYSKAISYFQEPLKIIEKTDSSYHPTVATLYNNIGSMYEKMKEYWKALFYYQTSYVIQKQVLPSNHPSFASTCNNIGGAYGYIGKHSKALFYFKKVFNIFTKTLPSNHPHLIVVCNNIGYIYHQMGKYSTAISYYEKVLDVAQRILPPYHSLFVNFYNNIGGVYLCMGQYPEAISFCEHALQIGKRALTENHPTLQVVRINIERAVANQLRLGGWGQF
ncbi:unnamed protein product [Adineta steineri]|uniref:Uncharacterized protein n=1 Tax=Adineta steineri TaxID=433720 RepID=A0A815PS91_9BILA|nr:unnamed protein product [Adineta steineri]CAF1631003.1 unnamed protein product [Adineta steineri]